MTLPLIVLAIGAVFAGFLGIPEGLSGGKIPNYFEHFLEPSIAHAGAPHATANETGEQRISPPLSQAANEHVNTNGEVPADSGSHAKELILTVVSVLIALAGIGIGWVWFNRQPLWQPPRLLEHKYYVDEVYDAAVVQPIKVGSTNVLWKIIDKEYIDGFVHGTAYLASGLGSALRFLQSGLARAYVAIVVLGALVLIYYFIR